MAKRKPKGGLGVDPSKLFKRTDTTAAPGASPAKATTATAKTDESPVLAAAPPGGGVTVTRPVEVEIVTYNHFLALAAGAIRFR